MAHLRLFLCALCVVIEGLTSLHAEGAKSAGGTGAPGFVLNAGQWDPRISAAGLGVARGAIFTRDGVTLLTQADGSGGTLRYPGELRRATGEPQITRAEELRFVDASAGLRIVGEVATGATAHFYLGDTRERWREGLTQYRRLRYEGLWSGIDAVFESGDGPMTLRIELRPGANPADVAWNCDGADARNVMRTVYAWQDGSAGRVAVATRLLRKADGSYGIDVRGADPALPLTLSLDFVTWFGGTQNEAGYAVALDSDESVVLAGITTSADYPLLRAGQSTLSGYSDFYISKFASDGRTLLSSTYFGGSMTERFPYIAIGAGKSIVMAAFSTSPNYPLTANAAVKVKTGQCIARFDSTGRLLYSSWLWSDSLSEYCGLATDRCGNVYLTADIEVNTTLVTPDALFPRNAGDEDGIIIKAPPTCDTILYATLLGGPAHEEMSAIAVDDEGNIIITGFTNGAKYPVKNAVQPDYGGGVSDVILTKIRHDGKALIFSTYLGGSGEDYVAQNFLGRCLTVDESGNIYVAGVTESANFPVLRARQAARVGADDMFIAKFSPAGDLLYSTYFGGEGTEKVLGIAVDRCGNLAVTGQTLSSQFPLVGSMSQTGRGFTTLFSADGDSILFSSRWGDADIQCVARTDSLLYFTGSAASGDVVPIFNAMQPTRRGISDTYFGRMRMPACIPDPLDLMQVAVRFVHIDTILVDSLRRKPAPESFPVTCVFRNTTTDRVIIAGGTLLLPPGWAFVAPATGVLQNTMIGPGDSIRATWTVRIAAVSTQEADGVLTFDLHARKYYGSACAPERGAFVSSIITLRNIDEPYPPLVCGIASLDTLRADEATEGYLPDTVTVEYTVRNPTPNSIVVLRAELLLPAGMGLSTIPAADEQRPGFTLGPGAVMRLRWNVRAETRLRPRIAGLRARVVIAYDIYEVPLADCEQPLFIEGYPFSACTMTGPAVIRINPANGTTLPAPIVYSFRVRNPRDSAQVYARVDLDLTAAPHLQCVTGDSTRRGPLAVQARGESEVRWTLRIKGPIAAAAYDTIRCTAIDDLGVRSTSCLYVTRIDPVFRQVTCSVEADRIVVDSSGTRTQPNPFTVRGIIQNTGNQELNHLRVVLLPGELMTVRLLSDADVSLPRMAAGEIDTVVWQVMALALPAGRSPLFTIRVIDSLGAQLAQCETAVTIPGISNPTYCAVDSPDTLRYDAARDAWTPDPFTVRWLFENRSDATLRNVELRIDLTRAPHLDLASGESAVRTIATVAPRARDTVLWRLRVARPLEELMIDEIIVRYRSATDTTWRFCSRVVVAEGRHRILVLCNVAGHDTVWSDPAYPDPVPTPLQLQYTIQNNGNLPLTGCSVAILPPPGYRVMPGTDSVKVFPTVMPGLRVAREWFLELVRVPAVAQRDTVRWVWSCPAVRLDTACPFIVQYLTAPPRGIVISPWILHFIAEQNKALPAAQSVRLWTGGAAPTVWQSRPGAAWLDAVPASSSGPGAIDVRPNTTALALGIHASDVAITATPPATGRTVLVDYELVTQLGTGDDIGPMTPILDMPFPNPAAKRFTLTLHAARAGRVTLLLLDALGRVRGTIFDDACDPGSRRFDVDAGGLAPGVYFIQLRAERAAALRAIIVR